MKSKGRERNGPEQISNGIIDRPDVYTDLGERKLQKAATKAAVLKSRSRLELLLSRVKSESNDRVRACNK